MFEDEKRHGPQKSMIIGTIVSTSVVEERRGTDQLGLIKLGWGACYSAQLQVIVAG
jgi:hypothetical protein